MADYIKKIRTASGDKQIDYEALANLPVALKNPNALTFTGANEETYDGSEPKTVNIPTALPNPNALTFTGAAVGTYDGAQALSLEIPSGAALDNDNVTGVLPISKGGTGATTAPAARAALGLGDLATEDSIPLGGSYATGTLPLSKGGTGATTAAAARTKLGLGTLATKSAAGLDGSDVTGTLPVSKGGTGQTTIAGILSALGISDYITAQGETNGFTWRKWASGVAECWKLHTDTGVTIQTAWGSVFESSAYGAIAYPSGLFTAAPCCTITPNGSPDGKTTLGLEIGNVGTAAKTPQWNYTRGTANASGQTINVAIYAIGAWK